MIIAGIRRKKEFSPNHIDNDAAIFNQTMAELRSAGFHVNEYEEDDFICKFRGETVVLHMARHTQTLEFLTGLESKECWVINCTKAIENCGREQMTRLLIKAGIPHPETAIIHTTQPDNPSVPFQKMWVKRGDAHAICAGDVSFVDSPSGLKACLSAFKSRNISSVVINEHLEGDLVKFYGVTGSSFFHWFYPNNSNHSKFGQEEINGKPKGIPFSEEHLIEISQQAARTLMLDVWGGDAIIAPDGTIRLIDFNDFPSFKPCREEAAKAIAGGLWKNQGNKFYIMTKPTLESTLKSADTEEWLDIVFYRPIGYRWALLAQRLGVTPNAITIASMFIGAAAGWLFYFPGLQTNIIGILLLMLANSFDSADGQLARMTGQKSPLGRWLDGFCGDVWFAAIYIAICLRMQNEGTSAYIWILALVTGYFHSKQAAMADYYRNFHLFILKNRAGSEFDHSCQIKEDYNRLSWKKNFIDKLGHFVYFNYTRNQEKMSPKMQSFTSLLRDKYNDQIPQTLRDAFRAASKPLMMYTNILSFNTRVIALFISLFLARPLFYFYFELTVLNLLLFYMVLRHESICKQFYDKMFHNEF